MRSKAGWVLAVLLCASGCNNNRSSLCLEMEISYNDTIQRCAPGVPYRTFVLEGTDTPGCPLVNNVYMLEEITHQCLPWLAEVECSEFRAITEFPDFCEPSTHFEFRRVEF